MVNTNVVNANPRVSRRPFSTKFSAILADFCISKTPLNMRAFFMLTKIQCIPPPRLPKFLFNINA